MNGKLGISTLVISSTVLLFTALLWAKSRDPFHREWWSLQIPTVGEFSVSAVMPDRGGPFPVVVWCHGSGGSLAGDGETLRQFASLGLAAVGVEYSKTNQAEFDAQFAAVLEAVGKKKWVTTKHTKHTKVGTENFQPETLNLPPGPRIAWAGNSLGAQRQLSFLARHPEQKPMALVRLNGGMVEELRAAGEHRTSKIEHQTSNAGKPSPSPSQEGNSQPATFNRQPETGLALRASIAHGENDEVFPASDARAVAEWLQEHGASVELNVFPGRGHGFGEDQPVLVRRAAEFCAEQLGATLVVPDTVRKSRWYYWLPVAAVLGMGFGVWRLGRGCACGHRCRSRHEEALLSPEPRWSGLTSAAAKAMAGLALIVALLLTGAHLVLPHFQATPRVAGLARQWCVRPELRGDFDWMVHQPWAANRRLQDVLEHLNLAVLQREQFASGLSEAEWREFVLSPVITESSGDLAWRRSLWEFLAPRVRRETESSAAAEIVVRELRRRVVVKEGAADPGVAQAWSLGVVGATGRESVFCAMLRSVGVAARIAGDGRCEFWSTTGWQDAPRPSVP